MKSELIFYLTPAVPRCMRWVISFKEHVGAFTIFYLYNSSSLDDGEKLLDCNVGLLLTFAIPEHLNRIQEYNACSNGVPRYLVSI